MYKKGRQPAAFSVRVIARYQLIIPGACAMIFPVIKD
jgi:hypothetical protein